MDLDSKKISDDIFIPDNSQLSEKELYDLDIYHERDDEYCKKKLNGIYGLVIQSQDVDIIKEVTGKKVLDIGSGLGTLTKNLSDAGFSVTAIEPDESSRKLAKEWFGVESYPYSIYNTPFEDNSFDTVILRDCVEHLDFELAMKEINRICKSKVIIFQNNLNFITRILRKRMTHGEFNPRTRDYYSAVLSDYGYIDQKVSFRDPLAFPLSGSYDSPQLIPYNKTIQSGVMKLDGITNSVLKFLRLDKLFCWRYLLSCSKKG